MSCPNSRPSPSDGKLIAFNGVRKGRPVIFAHIYGTESIPISQVITFGVTRIEGTYRTVLSDGFCAHPRATVKLDGQNGKIHDTEPAVKADCGGSKKRGKRRQGSGR